MKLLYSQALIKCEREKGLGLMLLVVDPVRGLHSDHHFIGHASNVASHIAEVEAHVFLRGENVDSVRHRGAVRSDRELLVKLLTQPVFLSEVRQLIVPHDLHDPREGLAITGDYVAAEGQLQLLVVLDQIESELDLTATRGTEGDDVVFRSVGFAAYVAAPKSLELALQPKLIKHVLPTLSVLIAL